MEFIRWEEATMKTGVATVDEQHRELIHKLNELHQATLSGAQLDDIRKILNFLGRFCATHFQHEEKCMEERKCPLKKENRMAHAKFLNSYRELSAKFSGDCDPDEIAVDIKRMAAQWLQTHICHVDVALRDCPPPAPNPVKKTLP